MNIKIIKEPKHNLIVYLKIGNTQLILNESELKFLQEAINSYFSKKS